MIKEKEILSVEGEERAKKLSENNELQNLDAYWLCIDVTNLVSELNRLNQNTLAELYKLNTVYTDKAVKIVD